MKEKPSKSLENIGNGPIKIDHRFLMEGISWIIVSSCWKSSRSHEIRQFCEEFFKNSVRKSSWHVYKYIVLSCSHLWRIIERFRVWYDQNFRQRIVKTSKQKRLITVKMSKWSSKHGSQTFQIYSFKHPSTVQVAK